MALYKGETLLAGSGAGFMPENEGETGQVLTKTETGYAYKGIDDAVGGGTVGQVLTKTEDGCEFQDAPGGFVRLSQINLSFGTFNIPSGCNFIYVAGNVGNINFTINGTPGGSYRFHELLPTTAYLSGVRAGDEGTCKITANWTNRTIKAEKIGSGQIFGGTITFLKISF